MKTFQQFAEDKQEQFSRVNSILLKLQMLYGVRIDSSMDVKQIKELLQQHRLGDALDAARIKQFLANDLVHEPPETMPSDSY